MKIFLEEFEVKLDELIEISGDLALSEYFSDINKENTQNKINKIKEELIDAYYESI